MTSAIDRVFGGGGSQPEPAKPEPASQKAEARAEDFKTRERSIDQRASAAGATRSDNDADVLGYAPPRKRVAGRDILG